MCNSTSATILMLLTFIQLKIIMQFVFSQLKDKSKYMSPGRRPHPLAVVDLHCLDLLRLPRAHERLQGEQSDIADLFPSPICHVSSCRPAPPYYSALASNSALNISMLPLHIEVNKQYLMHILHNNFSNNFLTGSKLVLFRLLFPV